MVHLVQAHEIDLQSRISVIRTEHIRPSTLNDIEDPLPALNSKLRLYFPAKCGLLFVKPPPVVSTKRAITTSEKRM